MRRFLILFLILFTSQVKGQFLEKLLSEDTSALVKKVLENTSKYRLQIIYTEVNEQDFLANSLRLKNHYFGTPSSEYFFPASLVKLPVSIFALEKLKLLSYTGISEYNPFLPLSDFQCNGSSATPVSTYELLHKIFVYSDNASYNYLYELCGQEYILTRLEDMDYKNSRIIEKISKCNSEKNKTTGPIAFYNNQKLIYTLAKETNTKFAPVPLKAKIGKGHLWNGKYISSPKDFSNSNFLPLNEIHEMLTALVFPEAVEAKKRFKISETQREMVMKAMSTLPRDYCPDSCNNQTFKDNHVKYILGFGDTISKSWKIYNKVGLAHGFMSDCSYFEDKENDIRFFISSTIYVNEDEILNDGKYDYYSIGFPFMKRLGQLIYQNELKKKKELNENRK